MKIFLNFFGGHPSKSWLGSMLLNFGIKWPPKNDLKMALTFLRDDIE